MQSNVHALTPQSDPVSSLLASRGGPPHDGDMEARVAAIEAILKTLASKVDVEMLRTDLHKMDASIKTWMIATIIALFLGFAGLFFSMSNSLNTALNGLHDRASVPQAQAPIVIQVPAQAGPAQPPTKTP